MSANRMAPGSPPPAEVPLAGAQEPRGGTGGEFGVPGAGHVQVRHVPGLRRLALGAFGLLCVIGVLQARMSTLPETAPADARQQRVAAVEQAATLLLANQSPRNHPTDDAVPDIPASMPTRSPASEPHAAVPDLESGVPSGIHSAVLPAMPQAHAQPVHDGIAEASAARQMVDVPAEAAAPRRTADIRFKVARATIPEKIESSGSQGPDGDPLATATISGGLRILDGNDAPLRLLAIRVEGGVASVQLHVRGAAPPSGTGGTWLREGDGGIAGWNVVSISRTDALVLSPHGNLFRLRLVPGKDPTGPR